MRFSRPVSGHELHDTERRAALQGLPAAGGAGRRASARRSRAAQLVGVFDFDAASGADLHGQGRDLPGERGRAPSPTSMPKCRAGISTRVRAAARAAWSQALGGVRGRGAPSRCARASTPRSITRCMAPEPVHGQRRALPRAGQRRAPGAGLHQLLDLLAVGHLPRPASAADADAAAAAHQRHRALAASPRSRTAPTACCRCGRTRARRPGA